MDPRITRARTGSLPGHTTSGALDVDLRVGGRSGSQTRSDEVLYSGRTSPHSSEESTPETVDSLANRGDSDNLGRVQPSEGGEQASAAAGAGANQDFQAGGDLAGSTNSPDIMHLHLRLADLLTHDCLSMRATRATRASLLVRQAK